MPNLPISQLPASSTLTGAELFADVQGGVTKYTTLSNIYGFVTSSAPGLGGSGMGWARYDDTQYTTSSFLTITDGNNAVIPNNSGFTITTHINSSLDFYNGTSKKIQMQNVGDVYSVIVTFKAKAPNANQTHMDITLSSTGATPYERVSKSIGFIKGNNQWENIYESFHFYGDADFVASGNQFKVYAVGGSVDIASSIYFIQRTFNVG